MKLNPASIYRIAAMLVLTSIMRPALAQQSYTFSAKQAVEYAMKNSVNVQNALKDIEIQIQSNREITAAAYPQISGSVNVTDYLKLPTQLIPAEFFGGQPGTFAAVQFGTKYNGTYGASLNQILFDGQVFVGLQARAASIEYAEKNVAVTQELIKANVYKIYYQLVVAKKQITLLDANIARAEKLLHDTKALFENGFQEKLDVDKTTVLLSNLKTEKLKVENQLQSGYVGLKYLMGMPVKYELALSDTLTGEFMRDQVLSDSVRFEDRQEFLMLKSVEKLNNYNIKRYKFTYIPTLSLTGSYSRMAQRQSFDFFKGGEPWYNTAYIGLQLNVPIFDGFAKDARVKQARLELAKTQNSMEGLKNQINNEVETARITIGNALIAIDEQTKNMKLAEEVYNQTKIKYEQGLGSNLEITNAETDLREAQNNYFNALYTGIVARVDYLKAIGKL
ncbi:transporter [Niastella yeongjuensis]|uniref:Transporter n=1 Tax=Niastella yeongjuensis TaxID=354355 RepID=A0A1V9ELZ4_9BACT|nr:TolC family protein [Niastella yeongjuensis]OQP46974.1 transporter [Niastella yeongjuensis]SEN63302.1 Outer membrane protein TolC [Niastella yeongjuensis]